MVTCVTWVGSHIVGQSECGYVCVESSLWLQCELAMLWFVVVDQ